MTQYNEYDRDDFFEQYAQMPRSRDGLSAAGEWHQLRPLFPKLNGKRVLDLGCGYGWHCRYAAEHGAEEVLGLDLSKKMIAEAKRRNSCPGVRYEVCGIEDYGYPADTWDLVLSNLALHYIEDLSNIFAMVFRTLKQDGVFLFNIEHPTFTAGVAQEFIYDAGGKPLYWPVDDYFIPGQRHTNFLGCDVVKYHHTLEQILMGLREQGFLLDAVEEARPSEKMQHLSWMQDELRRPMMLLVRAEKKSAGRI